MIDRKLSSNMVLAGSLWAAGLALVLVDLFSTFDSGDLGLMSTAAAMIFNIRGFFCGLERRERAAFELGRESVTVRPVR